MKNSQKGSANLFLVVVIIILVGVVGYLFFNKPSTPIVQEQIPAKDNGESNIELQTGLPSLVEAKRQEILKATEARDYKKLASLISSSDFSYLIGPEQGDKEDFEKYLRENDQKTGKSIFNTISTLLKIRYTSFSKLKEGDLVYVWPYLFLTSPKDWTAEDMNNMKELYSKKEIDDQEKYWNGYVGYRIGIDKNGNWVFYFEGTD